MIALTFQEAIEMIHARGRKLGRIMRLASGRWLVSPLPDMSLDRPVGFLIEVL